MLRFRLIAVLVVFFLVGCATVAVRPTIQDTEIIDAPFDKVWGALIATLSEQSLPIETIEKESGLVTTKFVTFASGFMAERAINEVAVKPSGLLYTWSNARYTVSVFVTKSGENTTRVKITSHIEAFENNVTKSWMVCYSNGVIEKRIFDSIEAKIE